MVLTSVKKYFLKFQHSWYSYHTRYTIMLISSSTILTSVPSVSQEYAEHQEKLEVANLCVCNWGKKGDEGFLVSTIKANLLAIPFLYYSFCIVFIHASLLKGLGFAWISFRTLLNGWRHPLPYAQNSYCLKDAQWWDHMLPSVSSMLMDKECRRMHATDNGFIKKNTHIKNAWEWWL